MRRSLGLGSLTFYGVGVILGAGIYSILGEAAGVAGEALWWSFLLASLAALLTGLSYAELATMFPQAGAEYVYLRAAWPRASWLPGTLGWVLVATGIATTATVALAFAGYASLFIPLPLWTIAVALVVAMAALNVLGANEASWANIVFTLVESAGLVALIVVGARDPDFGRVFTTAPHAGVLGGAALIFFAYLGFEEIANLAEEARHPGRDLPRAILIAVAVSTTLYVLVAAASVALLAASTARGERIAAGGCDAGGAPRLAGALAGVALFATANTALIAMMAASRLLFAMARGGDAPALLARTLARAQDARGRHSPRRGGRTPLSAPWGRGACGKHRVVAGARHVRLGQCRVGAFALHPPGDDAAVSRAVAAASSARAGPAWADRSRAPPDGFRAAGLWHRGWPCWSSRSSFRPFRGISDIVPRTSQQ